MFGLFCVMCRFRHVVAVRWRLAFTHAHWLKDVSTPVGLHLDWTVFISVIESVKQNTFLLNIKFNEQELEIKVSLM